MSPTPSAASKPPMAPRTKEQREYYRKKGSILGYVKLPPGRPPGSTNQKSGTSSNNHQLKDPPARSVATTKVPSILLEKAPAKKRGNYSPYSRSILARVVESRTTGTILILNAEEKVEANAIPDSTLRRHIAKARDELRKRGSCDFLKAVSTTAGKTLTTLEDREFIESVAYARDTNNNPMSRKELIDLIQQLSGCLNPKTAENHLDFLTRNKRLKKLKNGGSVVSAQKTSTKRCQVTTEQQLRWHTTIDQTLEEMVRLNLPATEFKTVQSHFVGNIDESCVMGNEGTIKVVGAADRKKHEKNMDDFRESITTVRCGNAAGNIGPLFVLAKGKKMNCASVANQIKEQAPPESKVLMTPNSYMTDETWLELSHSLGKGIRSMPVVKDHPDWWFLLCMDGYGSHVQPEALEILETYKIFVVKEEADSSHINQAYDQFVGCQS